MQIELPETDLRLVQTIDSVELRDATGRAAGTADGRAASRQMIE